MCFGSSKPKEQVPPPSTPPTTFDYDVGNRAPLQQQAAANAASPSAQAASFGSELAGGQ
jgi:hypothetical protein